MNRQIPRKTSERGMALVFALLSVLLLSILAVSIMSTSQSQSWTAVNYRLTAQARFAAEAGVQQTMNWIASSSYTIPSSFGSYTMTANPVQYSGKAVVLSGVSGVSSNYPDATVVSAYSSATSGKSLPNLPNASYSTYATLLRMTPASGVSWLSGPGGGVAQTWQITSVGTISGVRNASVQVVETFERSATPVFNYPIEATATSCKAIDFEGGDYTDSYNSNSGVYNATNSSKSGGSVATNGNVTLGNSGGAAVINGIIGAPNATVGACPDGITNNTGKSSGYDQGASVVALNPPLPWGCVSTPCYPKPVGSGSLITTAQNVSTSCASISGCVKNSPATVSIDDGGRTTTANVFTLAPGNYGNLTINSADVVHLSAGTYDVNSVNFAADGQLVVDSGPVVFNLVGNCSSGCPSDSGDPPYSTSVLEGAGYAGINGCAPSGGTGVTANPNVYGSVTCGPSKTAFSGIPSNFQMVYGGTDLMRLGGMPNAMVVYAPKAGYYTPGAPVGLYGSIVTGTFVDSSASPFHYDQALQNAAMQVGQFRPIGGFSWSKF
jgi:Tfp pilus assembly protein PilX